MPTYREDLHLGHKPTLVETDDLMDKGITTDKLDDAAVTTPKIDDKAIITPKLDDKSVTTPKLDDASVTTPKIADENVTTPKLGDASVTTPKIADKSVSWDKLDDDLQNTIASRKEGGVALSNQLGSSEKIGITQKKLTEEITDIKGQVGSIADEEDLTVVKKAGLTKQVELKLKDKAYDPDVHSGMGRKYLRKNNVVVGGIPFMGIVENVNAAEGDEEEIIDEVFFDRVRERFVGAIVSLDPTTQAKSYSFLMQWEDYGSMAYSLYVPISSSRMYDLNGVPYKWSGNDLVVYDGADRGEKVKNVLTQAMLQDADGHNLENTIFHIQYDYTLDGESIEVPTGSILLFEGGSISNGTLTGDFTVVKAIGTEVFNNVTLPGNVESIDKEVADLKAMDNDLSGRITEEANRAIGSETNLQQGIGALDSRLQQVEGLAELSVEGGQIGIASATDFTNRTAEGDLKIPTVGAILNGADDEPTANSNNLVKSGGVQNELALGAVYDVSAKNPTAGPNNDGKFESLSALLSDNNLNTLIPTSVRRGGMSIKFVQSSDNKYVQYIYTGTTLTGTPNSFLQPGNWQLVENPNVQKLATTHIEEEWDVTVGHGGHYFYLNLPAGVYEMTVENVDANNHGTFNFYFTPSDAPAIKPVGRIGVKLGIKLNKAITRIDIGDIGASITEAGKMKLVIQNAESLSSEISDLQRRDVSGVGGIFINGSIDSSGNISSYKINERILSLNYFKFDRDVKITADSGYSFYCYIADEAMGWVTQCQVAANTEFRLMISASNDATPLDVIKSHIKISTVGDNALSLVGYYECSTAAETAAKAITAPQYTLIVGGSMKVKMTNSNTAANATLNIGGTGAKPLYYKGSRASSSNSWVAGEVMEVFYDGTNYYANNVQGAEEELYDISANHIVNNNPTQYSDLASALGTNGANVPTAKRSGGMSVKFIRQILAVYRVVKTTGLESAPSEGTQLDNAPSVVSGTYNASQLSTFTTLPANVWASAVYYVEVSGDTTTYTSWTITKLSGDSSQYMQYRYLQTSTANAAFATVANWKSVNDEATSAISENNLQVRRKINVTAGSSIPASALNDIILEPGVYEFILRNVTTDNHGRYKLYGADASVAGNIDTKVAIRVTESGAKNFWVGDIRAAITTTGVMEAVITKKVDSPMFKTEEAINAVANKPGGILFGDFFYGTTSSTYMNYRRISNQTRIYFEKEVTLTTKSNDYRFSLTGYSEKEGGSVTLPYTDWVHKYTIPAGTYVFICIEKSTYTTSSISLPMDELTNAIIIKDPNEESIQELSTKVSVLEEKVPDELYITPVKGGISPDGSYNSLGQRIRGKDIIYADKDYIVYVDPGYWFCLVFYDSAGTFLNFDNDGKSEVYSFIPKGSYFNLFIGRNYVLIDISEWKHVHIVPYVSKNVWNAENYNVIDRNKEAINNILAAQKRFDFSNGNSSRKFTLAHITDIHDDRIRMSNFNAFVSNFDSIITACILTGDFVTLPIEDHYNYIMDVVDTNTKMIKVVGNHEKSQNDLRTGSPTYGQYFYNTRAEMYANLRMNTDTGKLYYYNDFDSKYRIIILNQYDTDEEVWGNRDYSQEQIDWFVDTLKDAATNNLHVIVAKHQLETTPKPNNKGFYQRKTYGTPWDGETAIITPIEDIIHAFMTAGTLNKTYNNSNVGSVSVNTTFDTAGVFVAHIVGHVHQDLVGYSSQYDDQLYLCLCNSGIDSGNMYSMVTDKAFDLARIPGSKSEDCFNVYVFDPDARHIKIIRVGSDVNDLLENRKVAVFEY